MGRFTAVLTCLLLFAVGATGQSTSEASHIGAGAGFYTYGTHWYYYNPSGTPGLREHYPVHVFSRTQLFGYYESPGLFSLGPIGVRLRGELHFGIAGGTKEDWLPLGETISGGGSTFGGVAGIKVGYPIGSSSSMTFTPYVFPSFHFTLLNSNGKDVGTQFAGRAEYQYADGWDETVYSFALGFGVNIELSSIVIVPEYRFFVAGGAGTDWTPAGRDPVDDGPAFGAFVISVGFKL